MEYLAYFFLGFVATVIGALPLGTVNVAVINTTIKESMQQAFRIIVPAAIGEVLLSYVGIAYYLEIEGFIMNHLWLQYLIALLLLLLGLILIFGKKNCIRDDNGECVATRKRVYVPKEIQGLLLGFFNPTVLIYWLFVVSFFKSSMFSLNLLIPLICLFVFLFGVLSGKIGTLYGYAMFSNVLKMKMKGITGVINRVIGTLLIIASIIQCIKLVI